jgi:hypothetical protein
MKDIPAFPTAQYANGVHPSGFDNGMTLRDYFAGQALAGGLEQGVEDDMHCSWWHGPTKIAKRAYAVADAMMKARGA